MRRSHERRNRDQDAVVAVLDIGSSKVGCVIAAVEPQGAAHHGIKASTEPSIEVLGFAQRRARGVKGGVVIDLAAAQMAVRAVVAEAEQRAQARVNAVHVAVNCGRPRSTTFAGHVTVADGIVRARDVAALSTGAAAFARRDGRLLLALDRIGFRLDGIAASSPPIGLAGRLLDADHHAVTVDDVPMRNLQLLIESCHLEIAGLVPAGYASALAATTEEERRLGVICLDIGAATTSIAVFVEGHFVFTDLVPFGGQHLTLDIARALGTPLAQAERIKALYGTLVLSASDEHELVPYPVTGENEGVLQQTSKASIGRVVRSRMNAVLQLAGARVLASSIGRVALPRVVLCGGTSRLLGLSGFVADGAFFQSSPLVRVACPALTAGLVDEQSSPAFACLAGLLLAAQTAPAMPVQASGHGGEQRGYFGRMERWLQESF